MKKLKQFFKLLFWLLYNPNMPHKRKGQVQFSALLTGIKGKLGGQVFQGGKTGSIIRTKPNSNPSNKSGLLLSDKNASFTFPACMADLLDVTGRLMPDGSYRAADKTVNTRNNIRVVSKAWAALTPADRQTWAELAQNLRTKNKFGDVYKASPYQVFMQANTMLLNAGYSAKQVVECTIVKYIDDEAQEEVTCIVCGVNKICFYELPTDNNPEDANSDRVSLTFPASTGGVNVITCSAPFSAGSSSPKNFKIIGIIETTTLNNFSLRLMLNRFFGKNIEGMQFAIKETALLPSGNFSVINNRVLRVRNIKATLRLSYCEKVAPFVFTREEMQFNFGSVAVGAHVDKTFLISGVQLKALYKYFVIPAIVGGGTGYLFKYGEILNPLDLNNLTTDKYGNLLPIPLTVRFKPTAPGTKEALVDVYADDDVEHIRFTFTGIGT